jgi:hypothetical protein
MSDAGFDSWAVLELMGHVRMAGRVTEEERFGAKMGRIDLPKEGGFTTVYFGGGSVYRMTPTTEEIARAVAAGSQPEPVHRWDLPSPEKSASAFAGTGGYDPESRTPDDRDHSIRDDDPDDGRDYNPFDVEF